MRINGNKYLFDFADIGLSRIVDSVFAINATGFQG
jgi:hypothetical protein